MLLYALLALASKHRSLLARQADEEASAYAAKCLDLVICALTASGTSYDDDTLATIVCIRTYEELSQDADNLFHYHGASHLLHMIPSFAHSGGSRRGRLVASSATRHLYVTSPQHRPKPQPPSVRWELESGFGQWRL